MAYFMENPVKMDDNWGFSHFWKSAYPKWEGTPFSNRACLIPFKAVGVSSNQNGDGTEKMGGHLTRIQWGYNPL